MTNRQGFVVILCKACKGTGLASHVKNKCFVCGGTGGSCSLKTAVH